MDTLEIDFDPELNEVTNRYIILKRNIEYLAEGHGNLSDYARNAMIQNLSSAIDMCEKDLNDFFAPPPIAQVADAIAEAEKSTKKPAKRKKAAKNAV